MEESSSEICTSMRSYLHLAALAFVFCSGRAVADHSERLACDEWMAKYGGPCLEGIPMERYRPKTGVVPETHRSVMGFVLGADDFHEAAERIGPAAQWHSGDAASSETKVCYVTDGLTLVMARNEEMSDRVDEFRMIEGTIDNDSQCLHVNWPPDRIKTQSGLRPGLTRLQLLTILGPPSNEVDGQLYWDWETEKPLPKNDPSYNMCLLDGQSIVNKASGVVARIEQDRVKWVIVSYWDFVGC